jgi:hypothetical protein
MARLLRALAQPVERGALGFVVRRRIGEAGHAIGRQGCCDPLDRARRFEHPALAALAPAAAAAFQDLAVGEGVAGDQIGRVALATLLQFEAGTAQRRQQGRLEKAALPVHGSDL